MNTEHSEELKQFGNNVRALRMKAGLTQLELAGKCGVDVRTIQRLENAQIAVGLNIVFSLADIFQIPSSKLLKNTN